MNGSARPLDPGLAALLAQVQCDTQQFALALQQAQRLPRLLMCARSFDELAERLVRTLGGSRTAAAYLIEINRQVCDAVEQLLLRVDLLDEDPPHHHSAPTAE